MADLAKFSDCFEGSHFIVIKQLLDQPSAKLLCIELGATLARISNEREHEFVCDFLDNVSEFSPNQEYWIGGVLSIILVQTHSLLI